MPLRDRSEPKNEKNMEEPSHVCLVLWEIVIEINIVKKQFEKY